MNLSRSRASVLRTAAATVLATSALVAGQPSIALADAGDFSVKVRIENDTTEEFSFVKLTNKEGTTSVEPNDYISAGSSDYFTVESDWDQGGAVGTVKYNAGGGGYVVIHFNNPYEEDNWFSCHVPNYMTCDYTDDQNYHAEVTFTITE